MGLGHQGKVEVVSSGLCLAEVCKNPPDARATDDKIGEHFEHDFILIVPVDKLVGTHARRLMMEGHPGLKPLDAIHLATAIVANVDEMHTFDDKLLALDGKLTKQDGTPLKICKPAHGGAPLPLLDRLAAPAEPDEEEKPHEPKSEVPAETLDDAQMPTTTEPEQVDSEISAVGAGGGVRLVRREADAETDSATSSKEGVTAPKAGPSEGGPQPVAPQNSFGSAAQP